MKKEEVVGFFLQAEDGIRDSVASRGLGDVYQRQRLLHKDSGQGSGHGLPTLLPWDLH